MEEGLGSEFCAIIYYIIIKICYHWNNPTPLPDMPLPTCYLMFRFYYLSLVCWAQDLIQNKRNEYYTKSNRKNIEMYIYIYIEENNKRKPLHMEDGLGFKSHAIVYCIIIKIFCLKQIKEMKAHNN